ncbi:HAD family phosphatase [Rhodococcus sp. HNM0569]|nr:HAD family phosphatase [Rhodococcus sp. HNM0569]
MDGTLLDTEKLWDVAVRELSEHLGGPMSDETREATIGASSANALAVVFDSLGLDKKPAALAEAKAWLFARVGELFGAGLEWRPGARDALQAARDLGARTALVTNTERVLTEPALDVLGRGFFDATVCGDEVSDGKPSPEPYARGAALLGLRPEQCLAIEDSPTGAASATAAGCRVLVVPGVALVDEAPRRVLRTSLVGLTTAEFARVWESAEAAR